MVVVIIGSGQIIGMIGGSFLYEKTGNNFGFQCLVNAVFAAIVAIIYQCFD